MLQTAFMCVEERLQAGRGTLPGTFGRATQGRMLLYGQDVCLVCNGLTVRLFCMVLRRVAAVGPLQVD